MNQKMHENYNFYKENGYENLLQAADQAGEAIQQIDTSLRSLVTEQVEKHPKKMSKAERDKWYEETFKQMIKVSQMAQAITEKIELMRPTNSNNI